MADNANAEDNTAPTSSVDTNQGDPDNDNAVEGSQPQSDSGDQPGEMENARVRRLSADKKRLSQEADYWKAVAQRYANADAQYVRQYGQPSPQGSQQPASQPPAQPGFAENEVDVAVRTLKDRGMVTRDELDQVLTRIEWDRLHDRNEGQINRRGSNLPNYDRAEVEEHARRKKIPDPMAAYRDLYFDEILDATKRGDKTPSQSPATTKPSKPAATGADRGEPMDIAEFRSKLAGPEGQKFYDKLMSNPKEFDRVMKSLSE